MEDGAPGYARSPPREWTLCSESAGGTAGNLVTDARIGALAIAYRAVVHTADRDFLRFSDVRCHFPLDA